MTTKPRADAGTRNALLDLAALIAPGHAKASARVAMSVNEPAKYAKKYAADRDEGEPLDRWLELDAALIEASLVASSDWRFSAEDVHANLAAMIKAQGKLRKNTKVWDPKKLFAFYDADAHLRTKTLEFIRFCGRGFSAHGFALVELSVSSDCYDLTLIRYADVARAQVLAKRAGGALVMHGPKTPMTRPLPIARAERMRPSAKLEKKRVPWLATNADFMQTPGFLHWKDLSATKRTTTLVDCRMWPPALTLVDQSCVRLVMSEVHGARVLHGVRRAWENGAFAKRSTGTMRIEQKGKGAVDLLPRLPDLFDHQDLAWVGEHLVMIPTEPTIRSGVARRPLAWYGTRLAPAKGLPDVTPPKGTAKVPFPAFLLQGFARTGAGTDVLIWAGAGFIQKGNAFVRAYELDRALVPGTRVIGSPAPGEAFFYVRDTEGRRESTLHLAERSGDRRVARFPTRVDLPPRTTRDGRVLLGLNRYLKATSPVLAIFHPETSELTYVPKELLGFQKDDQIAAYGMGKDAARGDFLWVLDDHQIRSIAWGVILALPRTTKLGVR